MKLQKLIGIITLGSAIALSSSAAEDKKHAEHAASSPMAAAIANKSGADFEAAFLGMMTLHHQGGVKMAKMAVEKAQSGELKSMMQKAVTKQQSEIDQMTEWLQQWHKKSPSDFEEPKESKAKMEKDMAELQAASGKKFDAAFSAKMAEHHKGAIEMGHLAHQKATREEVKTLGVKIAEDQEKERKKLLEIAK
jgi:uncharacterized protein (DUF305 family)